MWSENAGHRQADGSFSRIQQDLHNTSRPIDHCTAQVATQAVNVCNLHSTSMTTPPGRPLQVGIVGAGFAGLRCADVLLQRGCAVTIFEARNRLGGRVAQHDLAGNLVDLGPNWIHGTDDNPIFEFAKKTLTTLHMWNDEQYVVGVDGHAWSSQDAHAASQVFWDDGLISQAFRYSNEKHGTIDANVSLYDFFEERIAGLFVDVPADEAERKRQRLREMATVWGAYVGSSVKTQSLKFFWLEECIDGETPFVAETYQKILTEVARNASQHATIHLNTAVHHISGSPEGAFQTATVHLANGSVADFDHVVVTTPLGWLKQHPEFFEPRVPERLQQAIDNVGYGCLDKLYVKFETAFWSGSNSENNKGQFADAMHWLPPNYAPDMNPHAWDVQGMNLAALPESCAHPTILFYIYGDCSKHVASLVSKASSPAERDESLLEFVEPYFSRLPNYDKADSGCKVKAVVATAWAGDEYAGYGSYANFQIGLECGNEDIEVMRNGMPERRIWLAGEHTAPFVALGTSTGAYWSGEAVAKSIISHHVRK